MAAGRGDPRYQAYLLLRLAFMGAPIAFGLDRSTAISHRPEARRGGPYCRAGAGEG